MNIAHSTLTIYTLWMNINYCYSMDLEKISRLTYAFSNFTQPYYLIYQIIINLEFQQRIYRRRHFLNSFVQNQKYE